MMRSYGGPLQLGEGAADDLPHIREFAGEFARLVRGAVRDGQRAQFALHQRPDHPACRAARAEQQNPLVGQVELQVALEIADQPNPVGIVPQKRRVLEECDGIHGLCPRRARRQLVHQLGGRLFVRYGDVEAAHAAREQTQGFPAKIVRGDVEQPVDQILRGRLGKHSVYERRPAVCDRVPDQTVLIGGAGFARRIHCVSHSAARLAK